MIASMSIYRIVVRALTDLRPTASFNISMGSLMIFIVLMTNISDEEMIGTGSCWFFKSSPSD